MKRKHLFLPLGFMILLLVTYTSNAQPTKTETVEILQKVDESLANINTLVYKIDYKNKILSKRDTIYTTAICSLYIVPRDKMRAYNIVDLETSELKWRTYGHRRYDGKRTFWTNYPADSLNMVIKPYIDRKRRIRHEVVEGYTHLLLREYLMQKKPFGRYEFAAGNIGITEETLNDTPVYVLTLTFKDQEDVRDNVEKHYIRKSDYLPIAYSSFLRWENMEQYRYYEVEYLAINPDIPIEAFTVDKDETINAEERYQVFKEKVSRK